MRTCSSKLEHGQHLKTKMPNKKKDAKSGNQNASCEKPNDVLQAVILADSFNWRFSPITLERPRVSIWLRLL